MNLFFLFAISLLSSPGTYAVAKQKVLLNRDGEAVCRLADKVNLPRPQALRVEAESAQELDECTSRQILSALAEIPPEEIRAAGISALPFLLGAGVATSGCLLGMENALEKRNEEENESTPEDDGLKKQLGIVADIAVLVSIGSFAWLTVKELIHMVNSPPIKGRSVFLPRNTYLTTLAALGAGAFGASALCYILSSPHGGENSSRSLLIHQH